MVIIEAEITFPKNIIHGEVVPDGKVISVGIDGEGFISQLKSLSGEDFSVGKSTIVDICILRGETALDKIAIGIKVYFVVDRFYEVGVVKKIKEVYVEKEWIEYIIDVEGINKAREIVRLAEKMDNALIEDEVYSLI